MVAKTIFRVIITIASIAHQIRQQKKLEAELDKRKGTIINKRGEAAAVPIVYGKQSVGLIEANHKTRGPRTYAYPFSGGKVFNSKNSIQGSASGSKNEHLIMNGAICQGGIYDILGVNVDDSVHNADKKHRHVIHAYTDELSGTDPMGAANGLPERNKFTGCANATLLFKLNRDEPNYSGIPNTSFFVKGRKVREIVLSGGVYSFGNRIYSNNPALILADYLTYENGRGLSDTDLDLETFYNAALLCDTIVATNKIYGGTVNGQKPIQEFANFASFPLTSTTDPNEYVLYRAKDTGNVYRFVNTGDSENPSGSYVITGLPTRNIPLYECNIALDPAAKVRDNIESILSCMPISILHWSSEGKYKLSVEYPNDVNDLEALNRLTLNEDNTIRDSLDFSWLPASERYNQCTVTYLDEHEDFKENTQTWPTTDASPTSAYKQLLAQDNNQPMTTSITLEGITDPYHAKAYAEFVVRQSRSFHTVKLLADKSAVKLEPGDFIKLTAELTGSTEDKYYKVNSVEITEDLTVSIEAHFVDLNAFAWNVDDDFIPNGTPGGSNFDIEPAGNVIFNTSEINNLGTWSGTLTWSPSDDFSVRNYIVQVSKYNGTSGEWGNFSDIGLVSSDVTTFEIPGLQAGIYRFAVRAASGNGALSPRAISGNYTLDFSGLEKTAIIYADGINQNTNNQSYTPRDSDTHFAIMVYQLEATPTLPIRSSSSVSDATDYTDVLSFLPLKADSVLTIPLYRRSTSDITGVSVSGGTYNFATATLVPPNGWVSYIPAGIGDIYQIVATVRGPENVNNNVNLEYATNFPGLHAANGEDGYTPVKNVDYFDGINGVSVKLQYSNDNINWHDTYQAGDLYVRSGTLTPPATTYVYGTGTKFVPEKGVEYDDGVPGTPAYLHIAYADDAAGTGFSQSPTGKAYLGSYTDSNAADSSDPTDYTWVKILGDNGNPAPKYQTVRVYREATTAGTAPEATITWSTLSVTLSSASVTAGWTLTQPTIDADSTNEFWFSDIVFSDTSGTASTTGPVTGSTPSKQINFDGVVTFNAISTEGGMGTTTIHGGNITTGTLTASQIVVSDNVTVASELNSLSNQYNALDNSVNTLSNQVNSLDGTVNTLSNQVNTISNSIGDISDAVAGLQQNQITTSSGTSLPSTTDVVDGSVFHHTTNGQIYRFDAGQSDWVPFSIIADSVATNYVYSGLIYTDTLRVGSSGNTTLATTGLSGLTSNLGSITAGNLTLGNMSINNLDGEIQSGYGFAARGNGSFAVGNTSEFVRFDPTTGTLFVAGEIVNLSESRVNGFTRDAEVVLGSSNLYTPSSGTGEYAIIVVGAGGGGGLGKGTSNNRASHPGANGGGAGGVAIFRWKHENPDGYFIFAAGAGGLGNQSNNGVAGSGGTSSIYYVDGNTVTFLAEANGGGGGVGANGIGGAGGNAVVNAVNAIPIAERTGGRGGQQTSPGCLAGGGSPDYFGNGNTRGGDVLVPYGGTGGGSAYGNCDVTSNGHVGIPHVSGIGPAQQIYYNTGYNRAQTNQSNTGVIYGNLGVGNHGNATAPGGGGQFAPTTSNAFVGGLPAFSEGAGYNLLGSAVGGFSAWGGGGAGGMLNSGNRYPIFWSYGGDSFIGGGGGAGCEGGSASTGRGGNGGDGCFVFVKL